MEKPFVTLSTSAWHYKLIHFVLQDSAPTPQNMHNLCPYFWLLIFSIFASPFVALFRFIIWMIEKLFSPITMVMEKMIYEPNAKKWEKDLTAEDVASIISRGSLRYRYDISSYDFYYNLSFPKVYIPKKLRGQEDDIAAKWLEKNDIKEDEVKDWYQKMYYSYRDRVISYEHSHISLKDRIEVFSDNVKDKVSSWKTIIKWTKRTLGLAITGVGLFVTYFVVAFLSRGILYLFANPIEAAIIGTILLCLGGAAALLYGINKWAEYIKDKYDSGEKVWYIQILYYLIAFPVVFIFYKILWKFVVMTILWGTCLFIWQLSKVFLGIFGEYFSASYGDYCPGIEWEDKENKK